MARRDLIDKALRWRTALELAFMVACLALTALILAASGAPRHPASRRRVRAPLVVAAAAGGAWVARSAPEAWVPGLQQRGSVVPVPPGRDRGGVARLQARGRDDEGEHEAGEQGEGHEERGGERQVGPPAVVCAPSLARAARAGGAPLTAASRAARHRAPVVGARGRDDGAGRADGARPPAQPRTAGCAAGRRRGRGDGLLRPARGGVVQPDGLALAAGRPARGAGRGG